mgnify:FL=1
MIEKPLPRSSGIGRAANRERGSAHSGRRVPPPRVGTLPTGSFSSPAGGSVAPQPGGEPRLPGSTSNAMPTLSTKPIPWANPLHPLCHGISVKMWRAELILTAAVRCALLQEEGQAP